MESRNDEKSLGRVNRPKAALKDGHFVGNAQHFCLDMPNSLFSIGGAEQRT